MSSGVIFRLLVASIAVLSVCAGSAIAQEETRPHYSVGATIGTLGLGAEASYLVYDYLTVRAVGSYISLDSNEIASSFGGADSEPTTVKGYTAGLIFDLHPFADGWRVSAGARYIDVSLESMDAAGSNLGNHSYTDAEIGDTRLKIKNSNSAAPYLGFGYDAAHYLRNGSVFSLSFELGALYAGDPEIEITTSRTPAGALNTQLQADIALEKRDIEDGLRKFYWFYPVAMISGKLSF